MKNKIKKSPAESKAGMVKLSIVSQVFGYVSAVIILGVIALIFLGIFTLEQTKGGLFWWALIAMVYVLPVGAAFALVWIITSIIQCFKIENVGKIGSITPKIGKIVLSVFLSMGFLLVIAGITLMILDRIAEGNASNAEEASDIYSEIEGYVLSALPVSCLGQAIFNSIYTSQLKKSL